MEQCTSWPVLKKNEQLQYLNLLEDGVKEMRAEGYISEEWMNERKFVTCPVLEELPVSGARGLSLDGIYANGEHFAT